DPRVLRGRDAGPGAGDVGAVRYDVDPVLVLLVTICSVALAASLLTFFTGFGLGTLLLPAMLPFFAPEVAVALTAVVHFLNGLFKLALTWRHADLRLALRFAVPAFVAALVGARLLVWLA